MATLDNRETAPVPHLQSNVPLLPEIWVEIFKVIVDSSTDSTRTTFTGRKHNPLLILTLKSAKHKESYAKLVDLWIDRSQQCPLAIFLVDLQGNRRGRRAPSNVHFLPWSIPEPIVKECRRWETLYLKTSQDSGDYLWRFIPFKNSLINLKSIKIQVKPRTIVDGGPLIVEEQPQLTFIEGATKLCAVHLSVPELFFGSSLPFADLTTLDLVVDQKHRFVFPLPIFQCLRALIMCPKLLHAAFNCGPAPAGEVIPHMAPIYHPNLTELHIFETHTRPEMPGTRTFLEKLTVPYLTSLLVTSDRNPPDGEPSRWDHESMHDFLSRSPGLELLSLRFPNVDQVNVGEALKYLHCLSNLRHFTLSIFHDPQTPVEHDVLMSFFMKDDRWPLGYISRVHYWVNTPQKILNITTDSLIKQDKYKSGILVVPEL